MQKVIIGSDKSGLALKNEIVEHLTAQGYEVEDVGTKSMEQGIPYCEVAPIAAKKLQKGEAERAILICGTGMGMAIVANKYKGVYAAPCENTYAAEKSRAINDANILTMGGWLTGGVLGCEMADIFLRTAFTQGLEDWRAEFVTKSRGTVRALEAEIYGGES